jgi:ATP-dependent Lon protease
MAMTAKLPCEVSIACRRIKEKILAAKRANIKEIILCHENKSDIDEIKPEYIQGLTFHYVKEMSDVLKIAITDQKVKMPKYCK